MKNILLVLVDIIVLLIFSFVLAKLDTYHHDLVFTLATLAFGYIYYDFSFFKRNKNI